MARAAAQRPVVERRRIVAETRDLEADVVARQQAAIAIKGGVLDCLGRHRRAQLLEPRHRPMLAGLILEEAAMQQIERPAVSRQARRARTLDRLLKDRAVGGREAGVGAVGAIDREMNQQLGEQAPDGGAAEIAARRIPLGEVMEVRRAGLELPGEAAGHDLAPRRLLLGAKSTGRPLIADQTRPSGASPAASCCSALTSFMKS